MRHQNNNTGKLDYLQVREHAQQAPQQAAVYGLAVSLPLNEQQNAIDGLTLDLQVADDVEPEELQTHVPTQDKQAYEQALHWRFAEGNWSLITHQMDGSIEFCKT